MVPVHHDGNVRPGLDRRGHEMAQKSLSRVFARAGRALQDHRTVAFVGRLHDRAHLLHIINVECRHAVIVLSCVIE